MLYSFQQLPSPCLICLGITQRMMPRPQRKRQRTTGSRFQVPNNASMQQGPKNNCWFQRPYIKTARPAKFERYLLKKSLLYTSIMRLNVEWYKPLVDQFHLIFYFKDFYTQNSVTNVFVFIFK